MINNDRKVKIVLKKEILVNSATVRAAPVCNMLNNSVKYTFLPGLRNQQSWILDKTLFLKV